MSLRFLAMNSFAFSNSTSSGGHLRQAVLTTAVLSFFGILNFALFGFEFSLQWLPLLAVALWPKGASPIRSVIALLILGLVHDWLVFGIPGQWALIFILSFAAIRPYERIRSLTFGQAVLFWLISVAIGVAVFSISGRMIFDQWPNWNAMFRAILSATILFPLFWIFQQWVQVWLSKRMDGG